MIDGYTHLVGLIGWPVEHSLSQTMHNAVFDKLGLNWRYLSLPVPPGRVETAVRGLVALGFRGANVSVPHKRTVVPTLASVSPDARRMGAVNTLVVDRNGEREPVISGHNTDGPGFIGALRERGFELLGSRVVVVGAGGSARAVVHSLHQAGADEIAVVNRSLQNAEGIVDQLQCKGRQSTRTHALTLSLETLVESARTADLLVNATPVGMWPDSRESIWPSKVPVPSDLTVFDLVYNPLETTLLRQARQSGADTIDGLGMLVIQGALSLDLWLEHGLEVKEVSNLMRAACEGALRRQA